MLWKKNLLAKNSKISKKTNSLNFKIEIKTILLIDFLYSFECIPFPSIKSFNALSFFVPNTAMIIILDENNQSILKLILFFGSFIAFLVMQKSSSMFLNFQKCPAKWHLS